jgi:hypothetical protein
MENVIKECVCVCVCVGGAGRGGGGGLIMTSLDKVQTPSLKRMTSTCKQKKLNMVKKL